MGRWFPYSNERKKRVSSRVQRAGDKRAVWVLPLSRSNGHVTLRQVKLSLVFLLVFLGSSWSWIYLFTPVKGLLFASCSFEGSGRAGCGVHLRGGGLGPAGGEQQEPLNLRE